MYWELGACQALLREGIGGHDGLRDLKKLLMDLF